MSNKEKKMEGSDLIKEFMSVRLSNNLKAFEKYFPEIHDRFKNYKERKYALIYTKDAKINLMDLEKKKLLYKLDPVGQCLEQLNCYLKNPILLPNLLAPMSESHKKYIPLHGAVVDKLHAVTARIAEERLSARLGGSDLVPQELNSFFLLSTGLGFDFEKIYLERSIRRLFLIEPEEDVFYASLQLIDWCAILDKASNKGFSIYIGFGDDGRQLMTGLFNAVFKNGRHNATGGYYYCAFYKPEYEGVLKELKSFVRNKFFQGYGFYDDSRMSIAHTAINIKKGVPCIAVNRAENAESLNAQEKPVLVIGNGPSLDAGLGFIKENSKNAVVISCGSSLKSLYRSGVKPDIHVELERTAHVVHWLKQIPDEAYLKSIRFIGASQVHPDVFDMFDVRGMLPKDTETGSVLVRKAIKDEDIPLVPLLAPSCVHSALSAAILMGFREIYFFGVDMGFRNADYHHSKLSAYSDLNDKQAEVYKPNKAKLVEFESNFENGVIYSSGNFPFFKMNLENIVKHWQSIFPSVKIFNCSDGARLDGVVPLESSKVKFGSLKDKGDLIDEVFSHLFKFQPQNKHYVRIVEELDQSKRVVGNVCDVGLSLLDKVSSVSEAFDIIDRFSTKLYYDKNVISDEDVYLLTLVNGSLLYYLGDLNALLSLPISDKIKIEAFNEKQEALRYFFESVKKDFNRNALVCDREENFNHF